MTKLRYLNAIIVLVFGSMFATGQDMSTASDDPISVEIRAPKSCYRLREKIKLSITLKNEGPVPIYLYRQVQSDFLEGLRIRVYDSNGNVLGERDPREVKIWLKPRQDDFLKLGSSDRLRRDMVFTLGSRDAVNEGEYFVRAFYQSPVSRDEIPSVLAEKRVWVLQDDDIYSPKLGIRATSNCKE